MLFCTSIAACILEDKAATFVVPTNIVAAIGPNRVVISTTPNLHTVIRVMDRDMGHASSTPDVSARPIIPNIAVSTGIGGRLRVAFDIGMA
jgi:hypothetical protein